ncbi:MAG TPA: L,D-transpeptidase [Solirubrobacteraceae bacterium]|nr:L,D-transpeptidase [Solirubrobacteraceae bacterium]
MATLGVPGAAAGERLSLYHPGVLTYYGFVEAPAEVRSAPSASARRVLRLSTRTADGTSMLVEAIAMVNGPGHRQWLEIHMPVLPNSRTGWVPASDVSRLVPLRTWLVVDTEHLRIRLVESGHTVFSARIGVGARATPTPHGNFYVIDRLTDLAAGGPYGPLAFGTSAKSASLTDWPGGGVVGIHGTNQPNLIPGRPSHGCIRMRNADILRLGRLLPVGTPVTIE